jgi:hypothetical protein
MIALGKENKPYSIVYCDCNRSCGKSLISMFSQPETENLYMVCLENSQKTGESIWLTKEGILSVIEDLQYLISV